MSLALVRTRALEGLAAPEVTVEVHLANGLPAFSLVGLPDTEVREARDRVRAAIQSSHFEFPQRRITVNLAPADLPKEGGRFDLAIAVGILVASGQVAAGRIEAFEFCGELSLTGELRPVRGVLAAALAAARAGRGLLLHAANAPEAVLARGLEVLPAADLLAVCAHLNGHAALQPWQADVLPERVDDGARIWPRSAASCRLAARSRWRRRAGIRCCCSGHRAPGSPCSRNAFPASFPP